MARALKVFAFYAASSFMVGSSAYLILHAFMPRGYVFGELYKMFLYHEEHPFQYIAGVAFVYAAIASASAAQWSRLADWRRNILIFAIMIATILVASIPGGVLWKIHDMEAGFFTNGSIFWNDLLWGAATGLRCGWLIVVLSFPYNIICLIAGYPITAYGFKLSARAKL